MIARQVLRIKSCIYESATEFPPCSYRIFIPWASRGPSALDIVIVNCPYRLVMALSTTFAQYASEITKFGKIR